MNERKIKEAVDLEEIERQLKIREAEDDYNAVLDALRTVVPLAAKYPQTVVAPTEIAKPLLTLARVINQQQLKLCREDRDQRQENSP